MSDPLKDCHVLIVDDEALVAMLLEAIVEDLGCRPVGPAASVAQALALLEQEPKLGAALLDMNLGSETSLPIAHALRERGVPVVFCTGYGEGGIPEEWRTAPTLQKPFTEDAVREALMKVMDIRSA